MLIVAALAVVVFLPSLLCDFVFDDIPLISENHYAQRWDSLARPFGTHLWDLYEAGPTADTRRYYRPIVAVSYLVNWVTFGDNPGVFTW